MTWEFNHIHIKASNPEKTADWYVRAFNFRIVSDTVRVWGDRFIRCETVDGVAVNISGARALEKMGAGDAGPHWGLEHFGISVEDLEAEIERLRGLGAELLEGPIEVPDSHLRIAFLRGPDEVRIELLQLSG